ncbi:MAG: ATP phosphoribosyltransferase regulatory subunit [Thermoleophilaceae bacterium]|nr:ATP phosphoribosyltransferase regulatory subunit [Thermoleophilaceae bacterium]
MREERSGGRSAARSSIARAPDPNIPPASTAAFIHPIPPGTRDVLPDEMRELRAITEGLRSVFENAGYGEVATPALEYEEVLRTGDADAAGAGYRTFDERGQVMALRSDMTIPIARLVATRFPRTDGEPLRLSYLGNAYRAVKIGTGHQRELLQAGIELIGVAGADRDAEVIALALAALDEVGLARHRVGLGDGALYRTLMAAFEVPDERRGELLACLARRDLVTLGALVRDLGLAKDAYDKLVGFPELRGGPEILDRADGPAAGALDGLRALHAALHDRGVADRVILDLGLVRELDYYTGAVWEVYDPAVGFVLGGGGRYDDLIGRFGASRPACGVALDVQRVHIAQAEEEKLQ